MALHSDAGDHQLVGDLRVRAALRHQPQHIEFPRRQFVGPGQRLLRAGPVGVQYPCRHGRVQEAVAAGDRTDRPDQFLGGRVLQHEPAAPARNTVLAPQNPAQPRPHQLLIVHQQGRDHAVGHAPQLRIMHCWSSSGTTARTVHPSSDGSAAMVPPSSSCAASCPNPASLGDSGRGERHGQSVGHREGRRRRRHRQRYLRRHTGSVLCDVGERS